ncbi:alginate export family protein [Sphingomonas corticis]|uniref:Alginate export family protein n=1 Tax=Sphingomonas corticis TaxID=2722791 RepID=A0ABX1CX22_9SPHN|nr:alginate export family protein [Sphingomonas corticis]NJR80507.1 alginate export family protein [Sphingomonas corticis]
MRLALAAAALIAAGQPLHAQSVALKPLADARTRYETVEQDGLPRDADALTIRLRAGVEARVERWSALVEGQGTLGVVDRYFDGLEGAADRPLVADPQNVALYRAQLQYRADDLTMTAGRQRIALDDERFVGAIGFRQNGQTFDAVRAEWTPLPKLKLDLSYAWSVRTIWGNDGRDARQSAVSGDNVFANLSYATPVGLLTGFAYLVDQDEAAVQGYRLSSQTYGVRFAGARPIGSGAKLSYQASYARQADYGGNPNAYRAEYYLIDAALDVWRLRFGGGFEVLGADDGRALTSFQTPLGTNFKFQGWADKFLTTPPDGVRDLYGQVSTGWKAIGPARDITVQAVFHDFRSDRLGRRYGREWDLLASAKFGPTTASVRYADYDARSFATDTSKLWLQLDWAL